MGGTALSPAEQDQRRRLDERYDWACAPVMLEIERQVCGCDYGGSSWTTRAEADRMAAELALAPGRRLLDLGAGAGWPGLYLAQSTGCAVVLLDLPLKGLRLARDRAARDGLAGRCAGLVGDAAALPFPDASFDALSHSDLLCCLLQKRSVLAACRRVLRSGGRMVFTVISIAPGLFGERRRLALANGPEFVDSEDDYRSLLRDTGWSLVEACDVTAELGESYRRQLAADRDRRQELVALIGAAAYAERIAMWRDKAAAVADGLLQRERFVVA